MHASGAEQTAIGKVLGGEIANGEFRQDNVGSDIDDIVELVVNNLPFRVDNLLVVFDGLNANFGVFFFALEF